MGRIVVWTISAGAFLGISAPLMSAGIRPQAGLAYTDPGSGAMIIQLLTTFALMAAFYFSRARQWVAKRLGLGTDTREADPAALESKHEVKHSDQ